MKGGRIEDMKFLFLCLPFVSAEYLDGCHGAKATQKFQFEPFRMFDSVIDRWDQRVRWQKDRDTDRQTNKQTGLLI